MPSLVNVGRMRLNRLTHELEPAFHVGVVGSGIIHRFLGFESDPDEFNDTPGTTVPVPEGGFDAPFHVIWDRDSKVRRHHHFLHRAGTNSLTLTQRVKMGGCIVLDATCSVGRTCLPTACRTGE